MSRTLIILFLLLPFAGIGQNGYTKHVDALMKADKSFLSQHMTNEVDLAILDDEDLYSRSVAISKISAFFGSKSEIKKFELKHEGTSKLNHKYFVGDLISDSGDNYRMTFFLKDIDGVFKITQLRIEEF